MRAAFGRHSDSALGPVVVLSATFQSKEKKPPAGLRENSCPISVFVAAPDNIAIYHRN